MNEPADPFGAGPVESAPGSFVRRHRRRVLLGGGAALVALVLAVGFFARLPYVVFSPGRATPVDDVIEVGGVETYEPTGEVLYLTVSVSQRASPFELLWGWVSSDAEIVDEDVYLGGRSRSEVREIGQQAMLESQDVATLVALEALGYEVPVSGSGAEIVAVEEDAPADGELEPGDVVVAVDGRPVTLATDAGAVVRAREAGDEVVVSVDRQGTDDGSDAIEDLTLTTEESAEGQPIVGVVLRTRDFEIDFPVDVTIDTGSVGGPSAGLAFTLAIIEQLTEGDVTGGEPVAVTGTISSDGTVGTVGGVAQKAAAARDAGARLMLVPVGEEDDARAHAGDMEVVAVADLDDALAALEAIGGAPVGEPVDLAA